MLAHGRILIMHLKITGHIPVAHTRSDVTHTLYARPHERGSLVIAPSNSFAIDVFRYSANWRSRSRSAILLIARTSMRHRRLPLSVSCSLRSPVCMCVYRTFNYHRGASTNRTRLRACSKIDARRGDERKNCTHANSPALRCVFFRASFRE